MNLRIEAAVVRELVDARRYFDSQREGLGHQFQFAFDDSLASIARLPLSRLLIADCFRRVLVEPFEYHLYYEVEADEIIVVALLHARRDPNFTQKRLS